MLAIYWQKWRQSCLFFVCFHCWALRWYCQWVIVPILEVEALQKFFGNKIARKSKKCAKLMWQTLLNCGVVEVLKGFATPHVAIHWRHSVCQQKLPKWLATCFWNLVSGWLHQCGSVVLRNSGVVTHLWAKHRRSCSSLCFSLENSRTAEPSRIFKVTFEYFWLHN